MSLPVEHHRFDNGFQLVYQHSGGAPVMALDLWVLAGGSDERTDEAGLAHVVEHMLFKGTRGRPPGGIARDVENLGGEINAFTSFDHTVYTLALSSRYLEEGMDILHDAASGSLFEGEELEREKLVILEEIKRSRDMPHQYLSRLLFSTAYKTHPYKNPVIGTEKSVSGFSREDCLNFVGRWYRASNMVLVAVGNRPYQEVKRLAAETFGTLAAGPAPRRSRRPRELHRTEPRVAIKARNVTESYFDLAFGAPDAKHDDSPLLDVLSTILGDGEGSRLNSRIRLDLNLVRSVSAGVYIPADPGLFYVAGVAQSELLTRALGAILTETFSLCGETVTARELEQARESVEADFLFQLETAQSRAQKLGFHHVVLGDLDHERRYLERIKTVTPEELKGAAAKYLKASGSVLCLLHPKGEKPPFTARGALNLLAGAEKEKRKSRLASGREQRVRLTLPCGARLLVDRNRNAPIAALRAALLGGSRLDPAGREGSFHMIGECLARGTARRSVFEVADQIDRLGGHVEGFAGRNSFGVRAEFLSKHLDAALDLVCDLIMNPSFEPGEVEKVRTDVAGSIRRREDNPAGKAFRAFEKLLYGKHPFGNDVLGTLESVALPSAEDLKSLYRTNIDPDNLAIALVGDVDAGEVAAILSRKLALAPIVKKRIKKVKAPVEPGAHLVERIGSPFEQTHIICGFLGTTIYDGHRMSLKVANAILAGQGGRLFRRLRDEMALAYAVTSTCLEGLDRGYMAGYLATSPERGEEAREALLKEMLKLAEEPIDAAEVENAKRKLAGSYELALQENNFRAAQMSLDEIYGLDWKECLSHARSILRVTVKQVEEAARYYLKPDNWVAVMVGPED